MSLCYCTPVFHWNIAAFWYLYLCTNITGIYNCAGNCRKREALDFSLYKSSSTYTHTQSELHQIVFYCTSAMQFPLDNFQWFRFFRSKNRLKRYWTLVSRYYFVVVGNSSEIVECMPVSRWNREFIFNLSVLLHSIPFNCNQLQPHSASLVIYVKRSNVTIW